MRMGMFLGWALNRLCLFRRRYAVSQLEPMCCLVLLYTVLLDLDVLLQTVNPFASCISWRGGISSLPPICKTSKKTKVSASLTRRLYNWTSLCTFLWTPLETEQIFIAFGIELISNLSRTVQFYFLNWCRRCTWLLCQTGKYYNGCPRDWRLAA